jgi:phage baseplate assembly protein W
MTVKGVDAIKQSILNLVLTNYYEKPFRPSVGSNVNKLLFEPGSPLVVTFLQQAIADVITNYEPRASLIAVIVTSVDSDHRYDVQIAFSVRNVQEPQIINFFLQRVR